MSASPYPDETIERWAWDYLTSVELEHKRDHG